MSNNYNPINIFDFDGTLTTETWPKFLVWIKKFGYNGEKRNEKLQKDINDYINSHDGERLENFYNFFNNLLVSNDDFITYEELMEGERLITYNPNLEDFLKISKEKNYIVSSGLLEFLNHLEIAKYFDRIYGTNVIKNEYGNIIGISNAMNDYKKLQSVKDILQVNDRKTDNCENVYYIGDGYSDAEAMTYVHNNGGKAIFVHQMTNDDYFYEYVNSIYEKLNQDGIVDYKCVADYKINKKLAKILLRRES